MISETVQNPLCPPALLPAFSAVKPEHIMPVVETHLQKMRIAIEMVTRADSVATWDSVMRPLDTAAADFEVAWAGIEHLTAVADTPELRKAHAEVLPVVASFSTEFAQNVALYQKFKEIRSGAAYEDLTGTQKRALNLSLMGFRRSGADLPPLEKARVGEIEQRLVALSKEFSDNILDATNQFSLWITDLSDLKGLPDNAIASAAQSAAAAGRPGDWRFTLHQPSFVPFMQYAENRALREQLHRAYSIRASELDGADPADPGAWDNSERMRETLALRQELSTLLGFQNFAEYSLEPKMAASPGEVFRFLEDLAQLARPQAERDWQNIEAFGKAEFGITKVEPWDVPYLSERIRERDYAFSDTELSAYFPEDRVLDALFSISSTLFGMRIRQIEADRWEDSVRAYQIEDSTGTTVAHFYLDLYARPSKQGGAWMAGMRSRSAAGDSVRTPACFLTCNFRRPVEGQPSGMRHDEILVLFHEFGHGLHHLLTRISESSVSGLSGVEWDAVELPSQLMENFIWEWDVLSQMSLHVDTGEPLPRPLFDRLLAARNFQSGFKMLRQLVMAIFDMRLHASTDSGIDVLQLARQTNDQFHVVPQSGFARWPHSFLHIFGGSYAAGYYSYHWAEMLSADVYSAFQESVVMHGSVLNPVIGARYLDEILSVGGSRPAIESFEGFRGRKPKSDALLRNRGIGQAGIC